MRLHTGALPYKCNQCDKRFRTPANRKTHVQSVHMKKPPPELGEVEEQPALPASFGYVLTYKLEGELITDIGKDILLPTSIWSA